MTQKSVIIKLGGSVITDKNAFPPKANILEIKRLAQEIRHSYQNRPDYKFLIVHGAGCYGHILAHRYKITNPQWSPEKAVGAIHIRQAMNELNAIVVGELIHMGLPAIGFPPSANCVMHKEQWEETPVVKITQWQERGIIPVLYGDIVLDTSAGLNILSGDRIISCFMRMTQPSLVVLGTDVDGVFSDDPKNNPNAQHIPEITPQNRESIFQGLHGSQYVDVTGGMAQKITELMDNLCQDSSIYIIHAGIPGRLQQAILEQNVIGTWLHT